MTSCSIFCRDSSPLRFPDTRTHSGLPLASSVIMASALETSMPCLLASSSTRLRTSSSSSDRSWTALKATAGKRVSASFANDATRSWFVSDGRSSAFEPVVPSTILAPSTRGTSIDARPLSDIEAFVPLSPSILSAAAIASSTISSFVAAVMPSRRNDWLSLLRFALST